MCDCGVVIKHNVDLVVFLITERYILQFKNVGMGRSSGGNLIDDDLKCKGLELFQKWQFDQI